MSFNRKFFWNLFPKLPKLFASQLQKLPRNRFYLNFRDVNCLGPLLTCSQTNPEEPRHNKHRSQQKMFQRHLVSKFLNKKSGRIILLISHLNFKIKCYRINIELIFAPTAMSGQKKNSLKIKFWAGCSWDIRDPDMRISLTLTLGCPDKSSCKTRFLLFETGMAGMYRGFGVLGCDVPGFGC